MYDKLLMTLLTVMLFSACSVSHDKIVVTDNINLGRTTDGEIKNIDIECINNNRKAIRLREVHVSCSCLRTDENLTRTIESGDTTHFIFEYIPEGRGYVERYIYLYFNDFDDPHLIKVHTMIDAE